MHTSRPAALLRSLTASRSRSHAGWGGSLFLAAIWLRWRRASPGERRELAALWAAASILAVTYMLDAFASPDAGQGFIYPLWELQAVLQTALARALADPEPQVVYALEDEPGALERRRDGGHRWVDANGLRVALPPSDVGPGARAATVVERNGRPLAALLHDPALDPGLVRGAAAAAGMAIENEHLQAEVRAQLDEVRASRARIVRAGDEERLRIERDLHDGAQQRLLTLSLALRAALRRLGALGADAHDGQPAGQQAGLLIEVRDDGVGGADPALGSGLRGLEDRVAAVGGRLSVTSPPGQGTVFQAWPPCRPDRAKAGRAEGTERR
jgi:signal transduction histidine kinase